MKLNIKSILEVRKGNKLKPIDVRFKQTGDNKYVAMVACEVSI